MKDNSSGFAVVIIILLVVALIGSVGYIVYQNSQPEKTVQIDKSEPSFLSPSPHITSSPSPTIDPLKDWILYTNNEMGIRLKYPAEGLIEEIDNGIIVWSKKDKGILEASEAPPSTPFVSITINKNSTVPDLHEYVLEEEYANTDEVDFKTKQNVSFNNLKGVSYTFNGPYGEWHPIYLVHSDDMIRISSQTKYQKDEDVFFNQILSTFEFIE